MYRGGIKLHANKFIFSARLLHYIAGEKGTQDVHAQCVKKCNGGGRAALATTESSLASEGQRQLAQNHHDRSRKNTGNWRIGARGGEVTRMSLMASVAAMVFRLALTNTHKDIIHRYKGYPVENTRKKPSTPRVLSAAVGCPTISRKRDSLQHYANAAHTQNHIFNPVFFSLSLAMHSMLAISYHNIVQGS